MTPFRHKTEKLGVDEAQQDEHNLIPLLLTNKTIRSEQQMMQYRILIFKN